MARLKPSNPASNATPIFLAGVYRSGTTLLRLMLNAHARIAIPVESHFLSALIDNFPMDRELDSQQVNKICDFVGQHERFEHWETTPQQLASLKSQGGSWTLATLINAIYELEIASSNKPRWGDKTPGYERHFDQLAALFPEAKFIHIHRDGRDVSNSMCDRSWHGITEFQRATYWRRSIQLAMRSTRELGSDRCLNVPYENLVRAPELTLRTICEFLGEEYSPAMLQFGQDADRQVVDQKIHSKLVRMPDASQDLQRWKSESSKLRVLLFESLAADALIQCGYEVKSSSLARQIAKVLYWPTGMVMAKAHQAYLSIPPGFRSGLRHNGLVKSLRGFFYNRQQNRTEARSA